MTGRDVVTRRVGLAAGAAAVAALGAGLLHLGGSATAPRPGTAGSAPPSAATEPHQPDVTWETVAGVRVPVSRLHGPHHTADGRAGGYARSVQGAAIAAAQALLRTSPDAGPDASGLGRAVVEGYLVHAYQPDAGEAAVDVVLTSAELDAQGRAVRFRVDLRWQDGDWQVVAPPGGDWGAVATATSGLPAGLVRYGG